MATIKLEIVSPDKMVFSEAVQMVIVRSTGGELGILPHHAPLLTGIVPHVMRVKRNDAEEFISVCGGFMEVTPEKISVLASAAELPAEINIDRAQKAFVRAEKRLKLLQDSPEEHKDIDYERAHAALERAKARIQTSKTV